MAKQHEVVWTAEALKNLKQLHDYIFQFSVSGAENVVSEILERTKELEQHPLKGRPEPVLKELGMGHRYITQRHFKIIYRLQGKRVIIDKIFSMYRHPDIAKR